MYQDFGYTFTHVHRQCVPVSPSFGPRGEASFDGV